ncbi:hypothetical protein BD779DRAFT_1046790 [Infundibulicybe gibba]|nr:hypothetical protein BD779DRAFT_1046790 [Infundibulicybe gibba]
MEHIKRMRSKVFKKSRGSNSSTSHYPAEEQLSAKQRLRHSKSLPFRSSSDTDNSSFSSRIRPTYRGARPLKTSDIHLVVDISHESVDEQGRTRWPGLREESDYLYPPSPHEGGAKYPPTRGEPVPVPLIDKGILDQFPDPPAVHAYTSPRAYLPPGLQGAEGGQLSNHSGPPSPEIRRGIQDGRSVGRSGSVSGRQPILQRSGSTSSYSKPTAIAYPTTALASRPVQAPQCSWSSTHPPATYMTAHRNLSTQSLGPNAALRAGPTAHRPVVRKPSAHSVKPLRVRKASAHSERTVAACHTVGTRPMASQYPRAPRLQSAPRKQDSSDATAYPPTQVPGGVNWI